ncbi:MAG TPA: ATP-binding protein [Thermoanaerobaculia bacterium]|jgi:PAS domain S-box-containing protein|nr:ATP-binding protein [Thermoanaerobaculia bacterium]
MSVAIDEVNAHHHAVQFYEDERFLVDRVGEFLAAGAREGEPCVVIATAEHNAVFAAQMQALGVDSETVLFLDARTTLGKLLHHGMPDGERFRQVVGGILESIDDGRGRVRAYGEMVDLLWRDGEPDAAIRLEELWNDLASHHTFSLLCAYPMGNFYKQSDAALFERICDTHTIVRPTERSAGENIAVRDRRIALLEQRAAALEVEIAHRKQLETRLSEALGARRRSEEVLRDFVDNATVGLHWVLADGTIEWANEAELKLLGYTREEYVGRNISDFHADGQKIEDILCRLERHEEIHDYEAPLVAKDGSIKWVAISSNVLFEDDQFVHTRCFTRDITARKRLDEQSSFLLEATHVLSRSLDYRTRLDDLSRLIVPRLSDWCAVDLARAGGFERIITAHTSPELEQSAAAIRERWPAIAESELLRDAVISGHPAVVSHVTDEVLAKLAADPEHLAALQKIGMRSLMIIPMTSQGRTIGTITLAAAESRRHFTDDDLPLATDLASRAGAMIEIARLYHVAEASNRAKDDFLATLSHELRTPLTSILGWAKMLSIGGLDEETLRIAIGTIEQSARTQALLVDDLLDVSRVVSGKLSLQSEPVDLCDVIADVLRAMHVAAEAKAIRLEAEGLHGRTVVQGDSTRLQQVVWNLVSNAIKFSDRGTRVRVRLTREGEQARIVVEDEGPGIAPSFLPFVFDPFRQADSSVTRTHGGLGLGLAIVKYLAEAHGGSVVAQSEGVGHGATFTVTLPVARRATRTAARPEKVPDLSGVRIIVVDDDANSRRMLKAALARCGAEVEEAESVAAARASIAKRVPHTVITDIAMPDEDGVALLRHVRANETTRGVRVFALTAFRHREELQNEFDAFLQKPMDPLAVARRIADAREP